MNTGRVLIDGVPVGTYEREGGSIRLINVPANGAVVTLDPPLYCESDLVLREMRLPNPMGSWATFKDIIDAAKRSNDDQSS